MLVFQYLQYFPLPPLHFILLLQVQYSVQIPVVLIKSINSEQATYFNLSVDELIFMLYIVVFKGVRVRLLILSKRLKIVVGIEIHFFPCHDMTHTHTYTHILLFFVLKKYLNQSFKGDRSTSSGVFDGSVVKKRAGATVLRQDGQNNSRVQTKAHSKLYNCNQVMSGSPDNTAMLCAIIHSRGGNATKPFFFSVI